MTQISAHYHITRPATVLRATGPDAFTFLQSQFSNDLRHPGVARPVTYGLWLDQKGKIQADSFILQRGPEEFLIVSYDCPVEKVRGHLESHLIADEVELKDETGAFGLMHMWLDEVIRDFNWPAEIKLLEMEPEKFWDALPKSSSLGVIQWSGRKPHLSNSRDYLGSADELAAYTRGLEAFRIQPDPTRRIELERIASGVPSIPMDAGPGDLPQEAGLERDAVSFTKGCFLGQEVMARLKSMGHVNRALWMVQMKRGLRMPPGTEPRPLYAGEVVAGELRSRAGAVGMAMLKKRAIAGREWLSLTPGGEDVVSLRAEECARDLTLPPTSPG